MQKAKPPLAIIDIGSNSARIVVYDREAGGHLRIVASARSSLRLVEGVVEDHAIGEEAMERARDALRDFRAIALGAGSTAVRLATPAELDALNARIASGVQNNGGAPAGDKLEAAIIRVDGTFAYPVREEIPVMLIDEAIPLRDGLPPLRYVPPAA